MLCADDPGAASIALPATARGHALRHRRRATRGSSRATSAPTAAAPRSRPSSTAASSAEIGCACPGAHNVLNALAALGSGLRARRALAADGARGSRASAAWSAASSGSARRAASTSIDDYAHHPDRDLAPRSPRRARRFPGRRIVAAFQPHLFTRTRDFARRLRRRARDGGRHLPHRDLRGARAADRRASRAALIVKAPRATRRRALAWRGEPRRARGGAGAAVRRAGDVVLTLGAGDITRTGPELLALPGGRAHDAQARRVRALAVARRRGGGGGARAARRSAGGDRRCSALSLLPRAAGGDRRARYLRPERRRCGGCASTPPRACGPTSTCSRARVAQHPQVARGDAFERKLPGTLVVRITRKSAGRVRPGARAASRPVDATVAFSRIDPSRGDVDLPVLAKRGHRAPALLADVRARAPGALRAHQRRAATREGPTLQLHFATANVRVRSRDIDRGPARRYHSRRGGSRAPQARAPTELDLRFRDQVIARTQ